MMAKHFLRLALACLVIVHTVNVYGKPLGTIKGKVVPDKGEADLTDVVIWLEPIGPMPTYPVPTQRAEMAQESLAFVPNVLPVLVGTTVDFPNHDQVYHSIYSFSRQQRLEIGLYRPGETRSVTFDKLGLAKLFCNIHAQMFGSILVLPTPYFTTADSEGRFTIDATPVGDYTLKVWHQQLRGNPKPVEVKSETVSKIVLTLQTTSRGRKRMQ